MEMAPKLSRVVFPMTPIEGVCSYWETQSNRGSGGGCGLLKEEPHTYMHSPSDKCRAHPPPSSWSGGPRFALRAASHIPQLQRYGHREAASASVAATAFESKRSLAGPCGNLIMP